jgi:hypothetical protein
MSFDRRKKIDWCIPHAGFSTYNQQEREKMFDSMSPGYLVWLHKRYLKTIGGRGSLVRCDRRLLRPKRRENSGSDEKKESKFTMIPNDPARKESIVGAETPKNSGHPSKHVSEPILKHVIT